MVCRDYYRGLSAEAEARYKFEFCVGCALYAECELVEEYARFKDNHPPIHNSQVSQAPGDVLRVRATAVPVGECAADPSRPLVNARVVSGAELKPPVSVASANSVETSELSYDQVELEKRCLMSQRSGKSIYSIACGRQRVTEGIGDHYKIETRKDSSIRADIRDRWEPLQPVFISAQTGQGKNYFVENALIPYVKELNYKNTTRQRVLILSNRLALREQIKNRLKGNDDPTNGIYPYAQFAYVMTYQSLLSQEHNLEGIQKNAHSRYIYVICDEAHFFTSDAMFNPHTSKILSAIVKLFQDAVRVYMSATPYECLEYIINEEDNYKKRYLNFNKPQDKQVPSTMVFYHFSRDYSYLNIKIYSEISELFEIIAKSVDKKKGGERWLIFIDDMDLCERVKRKLEQYRYSEADSTDTDGAAEHYPLKGKVLAVNAGSKNDELYISIVKSEQLDNNTSVLITTSVLDNGVNLRDIDNIVVSDMSKVKCLQMVGRARVSGPADRKTLYVKRFSVGEVEKRIAALERQGDAYLSYELACRGQGEYHFLEKYYDGSTEDWVNAKHWFGRPMDTPTKLYLNEIAKSLLDRYIQRYKAISKEMAEDAEALEDSQLQEGVNCIGQKYLEHQLSWLGKVYCRDNDVTFSDKDKAKKALIAFLESYVASGNQITGADEKIEFRAEFTKLSDMAFGRKDPNKNRNYSILKMNLILEEESLSYKIASQSSYWTVEKHDWNTEEE